MDLKQNQQALRFVLEHYSDFFKTSEIINILLVCKGLAESRNSYNFLHYIGQKCNDPSYPYSKSLRNYFKKLLKDSKTKNYDETHRKALDVWETKYVLSRNAIMNSSGKYKLKGWDILRDGGDRWKVEDFLCISPHKTCFSSSYFPCQMRYSVPIERFLKPNMTVESLLEKAVFKAGCSIARRWDCAASGRISFSVLDSEENTLYFKEVERTRNELPFIKRGPAIYKRIEFIYKHSQENKQAPPKCFTLTIEGQDERFWKGWYGARFSDATISVYFENVDDSIEPLKIANKEDKKALLEADEQSKILYPDAAEIIEAELLLDGEYSDDDSMTLF